HARPECRSADEPGEGRPRRHGSEALQEGADRGDRPRCRRLGPGMRTCRGHHRARREVRLRPLAPGVADPVVAPQDRGFADRAHSGPPTEERMVPFSDETARPRRRRETVEPGERDVAVRPHPLVVAAVLAATYYAGAKLGFAFTFSPHPVSTLWLPNAVILASLLLVPPRSWWILLFAVLPVHLGVELSSGVPLAMVLCWFISNTSEALIGAGLMRRFADPPYRLDRYGNLGVFVVCVVFLAPFLSSFLDAAFVMANDWGESGYWTV